MILDIEDLKMWKKNLESKIGDIQSEMQVIFRFLTDLEDSPKQQNLYTVLELVDDQLQNFLRELEDATPDELIPPKDPEDDEEEEDDTDEEDEEEEKTAKEQIR